MEPQTAEATAPAGRPTVEGTLEEADRLVAAGDPVAAVDLLSTHAARQATTDLLFRLLEVRHAAAAAADRSPRDPWPPSYDDPFPEVVGDPPEVAAAELGGPLLGATVAHHGMVLVRGLFDGEQVDTCRGAIDEVHRHRSAKPLLPGFRRWFKPWPTAVELSPVLRSTVWEQGGTWLADSPASTEVVLRELWASGALGAITEHFGERPLFSLQKSTLRRSAPVNKLTAWHQDGSFLGAGVRTMNVWVALTPCGGDRPTPGLEVVPRRLPGILPTDGDLGQSSISDATVLAAADDTPPVTPLFEPGDALIFDERMAHRSFLTPGMTDHRDAIECWLFSPAGFAEDYESFLT